MEDKRKEKQGEIDQLRKEMDELKESHKTEIARARLDLSTERDEAPGKVSKD